jgi:microcystin-dependent protein
MATLTIPHSFIAGTPALASEVNANFQAIVNWTNSNIGTDNLGILTARSVALPSSPTFAILSLSQTASQTVISINNQGTDNPLSINQSGVFATGKGAIVINDPTTQTTSGAAHLLMSLSGASTIPAIRVAHGADVSMSLTRTQLDLFNSAIQATASAVTINTTSVSFFSSAIEFSNARIKLPIRTTAERDVVTQEGSVLYNDTDKRVQYRDSIGWNDLTPAGVVQMYAGATAPTGWLICDGSEVSQSTYPSLFAIIGSTYNTGGEGAGNFRVPDCRGVFVRGAATNTIAAYTFTIAASTVTAGAVYSNNSQNFTVLYTTSSATTLQTRGAGDPTSTGTLTKVSGTGPSTISFTAVVKATYSGILGQFQADSIQNITGQFAIGNDRLDAFSRANFVSGAFAKSNVASTGVQIGGATGQSDGLLSFDASRIARTSTETRPANIALNYIIKT